MIRIAVIGYGLRASRMISRVMQKLEPDVEIVAITDPNVDRARQTLREEGMDPEKTSFYLDADEMLDTVECDGVLIGTRCSLHSLMAVKVLKRNIPLFLEKPVATNMHDLIALRDAAAKSKSEIVVSFPLRLTPLVQLAKEIIDSGQIGTVEHVQAVNNVPYGMIYYQCWYRDENETQGLFLQKATHDFDYINYLLGTRPTWIAAMTSKQIFKGDRPAELHCRDCEEKTNCPDSPYNLFVGRPPYDETAVSPDSLKCAYAVDTGNEDSGSAIIRYDTGAHVSYSQNFFARKKAGKRGATFLGYKGTLEFDWRTDELKVYMHHTPRVETHKVDADAATHGGGDFVLMGNFIKAMRGEQSSVKSSIDDGLLSALMCLKAKESAATGTFQEIEYPDR